MSVSQHKPVGMLEHLHHLSSSDPGSKQGKLNSPSEWGGLGAPQQCGGAAPCVKSPCSSEDQELSPKFPSFTFGSRTVMQTHSRGQGPLKTMELSIKRASSMSFAIK